MHVRTPCVGLCSTTFGDLVCRGCKRWAHEIVGWNGFDDVQKAQVVTRLTAQRDGCVAAFVVIDDESALHAEARRLGVAAPASAAELVLALLRRGLRAADMGCRVRPGGVPAGIDARDLYGRIEAELQLRAEADYERSFRVRVR